MVAKTAAFDAAIEPAVADARALAVGDGPASVAEVVVDGPASVAEVEAELAV
jgi:hypothetical protein